MVFDEGLIVGISEVGLEVDGDGVGYSVGLDVGFCVGPSVCLFVGLGVGKTSSENMDVGVVFGVGSDVGRFVGVGVGLAVGSTVGFAVAGAFSKPGDGGDPLGSVPLDEDGVAGNEGEGLFAASTVVEGWDCTGDAGAVGETGDVGTVRAGKLSGQSTSARSTFMTTLSNALESSDSRCEYRGVAFFMASLM